MSPMHRNLIVGLAAAMLVLSGLVAMGIMLLWPRSAIADAPSSSCAPGASCSPGPDCSAFPIPDPAQALPTGLQGWEKTGSFALPRDAGATVLGIGPQGLVALGGRNLFHIALPESGSGALRLIEPWPLDFEPSAMALAPDGRIFLADGERIRTYSPNGQATGQWELPPGTLPIPCLAASADRLFVASAQKRAVLVFDYQGLAQGRLEPRPDQDFVVPGSHFAVCSGTAGPVAVNPGRRGLMFFSPFGQETASWFRSGAEWEAFQGCCNPISIAALPVGQGLDDLIVTAEKGVPRVKIVSRAGKLLAVLAGPAALGAVIQDIGLAVDATGRVYILDSVKQEITIHERQRS